MVPADPDTVTPESSPDAQEQVAAAAAHPVPRHLDRAGRGPGRIGPVPVGLLARPAGRHASPGTPPSAGARRSSRSGTRTTRSATATPAATSTGRASSRAPSAGMIEALGDPYSAYLTSDEYRDSLHGISGQFEGIGAEIATEAPDGTEGCSPLGTACRLVVTKPIEGSPAEKAGVKAGDVVVSVDGAALDGLTVDAARDRIRGPKGIGRHAHHPARRRRTDPADDHPRRRPDQGGREQGPGRRDGRLHRARRASRTPPPTTCRTRLKAHLDGGPDEAHPRPARQPGRLRHGRAQDRQPVHRVRAGLLGAGRAGQPGRDRRARRRRRDRRRPPASSSSSTAAARRPARSSPGALQDTERAHARRPAVVRQGHRPAVAGAERRGRGVQADDRPLADPGQALDPRRRARRPMSS